MFICRCPQCNAITEAGTESSPRLEFDFVELEIRFVCPECKKESRMSILTSNKLKSRPLPKTVIMR